MSIPKIYNSSISELLIIIILPIISDINSRIKLNLYSGYIIRISISKYIYSYSSEYIHYSYKLPISITKLLYYPISIYSIRNILFLLDIVYSDYYLYCYLYNLIRFYYAGCQYRIYIIIEYFGY